VHQINSSFWNQIKSKMKGRNDNNKLLETWLDPIEYLQTIGTPERPKLVLGVPNPLHQYFVIENLQDKIYSEISDSYKDAFEVEFVISGVKTNLSPENNNSEEGYTETDVLQAQWFRTVKIALLRIL
jgi:chromosomal replication initiator protein